VYSCNGRPYVKQFKEKPGIWFQDIRKGSNTADAHPEFHSPTGLMDRLLLSRVLSTWQLPQQLCNNLLIKNLNIYAGYGYPSQIISHAIWLYHRFTLSFRDIEVLLATRGIVVTYETTRQ
jgi:putative transposase